MTHAPPRSLLEVTLDSLAATHVLIAEVAGLAERVTVADNQRRRMRNLALGLAGVFMLVLVFGSFQWNRVTEAIEGNQANAIQSCQNANETREANRALWKYVLTLSGRDAAPGSPEEQTLTEFKAWIEVLYQPHDCSDLGREYPIPDPPSLVPPSS